MSARKTDKTPPPRKPENPGASRSGAKRPVLQFVLLFALFLAIFYVVMSRPLLQQRVFPAYLDLNAAASGWVLNLLGQDVTVTGKTITGQGVSVRIMRGCDAIEPTALFVAAVLATPVAFWPKLLGAAGGALVLAAINLVRIVTLMLTRIHAPKLFDVMHVEVWQGLFICLSLVLWIAWALWATKQKKPAAEHVSD